MRASGTQQRKHYSSRIYCVLNVKSVLKAGFVLFLAMNGVVLIYDDVPADYFRIAGTYPHLTLNAFQQTVAHSLPREVATGVWRNDVCDLQKYMEYLPSGEMSKYIAPATRDLFPRGEPSNVVFKRREAAWECLRQEPLENIFNASAACLLE